MPKHVKRMNPHVVHEARYRRDLALLAPIVRRLAKSAGRGSGVNVGNLKLYLKNHPSVLLASAHPSYVARVMGHVMQRAGLARTGRAFRLERSLGGNVAIEWSLPEWCTGKPSKTLTVSRRRAA